MKKSSSLSCPVCGEPVPDNLRECPNCGAILPVNTISAEKARHPWLLQVKRAEEMAAQKKLERELKTVGKFLDAGDFSTVLKKYQAIRASTKSYKPQRISGFFLDLLEKSTRLLIQQKNALDSAPRYKSTPPPKVSHPPSLFGRLARFSVLILAGIGLLGLFDLVPAKPDTYIPTTQTEINIATEITPDVAPTVTLDPTPSLPDPSPIFNNNIDKIGDLFHWPAGEDIESLSFSPDGNLIASGDSTGVIKVWQLWTHQPILELSGTYVAFSPDGQWIGTAGSVGLDLYNTSDGSLVRSFDKDHSYFSVLFSPDSQLIVGGSDNGKFYIWSVNDGAEQKSGGSINGPIHSLSFSQDGLLLAVASNESTYIWNLQKQKIERSVDFPKQKPVYYSVTLDMDGEWFAMGHEDGQMYIWRMSNGERMAVFNDESRFVYGLQFFRGTNFPEILVSGDEVNLSFWVMNGYETALRRSIYMSTPILSLSVAPENKLIATGGKDGVVHLWGVLP